MEEDASLSDSIFFDLMYQLAPEIKQLYWQGYYFESVYDYGEKLLNECLVHNEDNDLLETANNSTFLNKLKWFVNHTKENAQVYAKVIDNLQSLITREPLEIKMNALRTGFALTGKESFKIADQSFNTISEFSLFLQNLYQKDLLEFRDFCIKNKEQIENIAKLFQGDKRKQFEQNLLSNKQIIEIGKNKKFYFRDYEEIARYTNQLWQEDKLEPFHFFTKN
jgi:hypothetical protein